MNPTFRRRVFTPLIMPATVVGGILLFAYSLARILLTVTASVAVLVAALAAAYVLFMAAAVAGQGDRISSRALGGGLAVGFIALVIGGAIAGAAGVRELEHTEPVEDGEAAAPGAEEEIPPDALPWTTETPALEFTQAPAEGTAGTVTIALDNPTGVPHNVTFEGVNNDMPIVEATNGVGVEEIDLEPGTYTYYCSVPSHREAGMEGQLTLS